MQGVLNWVGQWAPGQEPAPFEARLYDVLFNSREPGAQEAWLSDLNPGSLEVVRTALATPALAKASIGDRCAALQKVCGCVILEFLCIRSSGLQGFILSRRCPLTYYFAQRLAAAVLSSVA